MTNKLIPERITINDLGGVKRNAYPVEDATTDLDSLYWNLTAANVAAMTNTAIRAWVKFSVATGEVTLVDHNAVWGDGIDPVLVVEDTGIYSITYDATQSDSLIDSGDTQYEGATEHTLALAWVQASVYVTDSTLAFVTAEVVAGNEISISLFNTSFANANIDCTITVLIG